MDHPTENLHFLPNELSQYGHFLPQTTRRNASSQDGQYGFIWHSYNGTCHHLAIFCWLEVSDPVYTQEGNIMQGINTGGRGSLGSPWSVCHSRLHVPPVIHVPSVCKMYFTYSQGPQKFYGIKSSPQVPEPFFLNQAQI